MNPFRSQIKVFNFTSKDLIMVTETDPNAMIIKSASGSASTGGGSASVDKERAIVVRNKMTIVSEDKVTLEVSEAIYVSIFYKIKRDHYKVICLNYKMNARDRAEVSEITGIDEVTDIDKMSRYVKREGEESDQEDGIIEDSSDEDEEEEVC